MRGWLARIDADVRRANQWLDPAWKPRERMRAVVWSPPAFAWRNAKSNDSEITFWTPA